MSIELQLRAAALAAITSHNVRTRLRSTCPPLISGFSIDHLEVAADASVEQAASSVQVHVPVDVFVVADAALFAAVNDVPDGATKFGRPDHPRVRTSGHTQRVRDAGGKSATRSVLTLTLDRPDLKAFAPLLGPKVAQVEQSIQAILPPVSLDLTAQLALLGVTSLRTADVVLANGVVAARFGVAGAPRSRLFPGQEWGLFLDSAAVEQLVRSKVEPPVKKSLQNHAVGARITSVGTVPHVDVDVGASLAYTILKANFTARLRCDFSLLPGSAPVLRTTVVWSVKVSLPDPLLLPFFLQGTIEHIAEGYAEDAIDPAQFGGTPTGAHTFVMDAAAPLLPLPGSPCVTTVPSVRRLA